MTVLKIATGIVTEIEIVTEKGTRKKICDLHLTLHIMQLLGYQL